jgi:hypothetical protein
MRTRVIGTVCSFAQSDGRGSGNPLRWTILPIRPLPTLQSDDDVCAIGGLRRAQSYFLCQRCGHVETRERDSQQPENRKDSAVIWPPACRLSSRPRRMTARCLPASRRHRGRRTIAVIGGDENEGHFCAPRLGLLSPANRQVSSAISVG